MSTSFINKSVNFSQTNLLKTNFLSKCLEKVNSSASKNNNSLPSMSYHIVPNNGKKYYAYITDGSNLLNGPTGSGSGNGNSNEKTNLIYLFPDSTTINYHKDIKNETNSITDLYMEISHRFSKECLFEGYLYKSDDLYNRYTYLLTDILFYGDSIVHFDYASRYTLLNEMIQSIPKSLRYLNDHLTIGIHPVFDSNNENIVKIFTNNFIFKKDICCMEHVHSPFDKKIFIQSQKDSEEDFPKSKKIKKTKYPDVYDVFDGSTGNAQGILYVKGIGDSKYIKKLFSQNSGDIIEHLCKYNKGFNKWELHKL